MGQSTDALLYYGFDFLSVEEDHTPEEDELDKWYGTKTHGCEVDSHCSGDFPVYFVAVKDSRKTAHRGFPKELAPNALEIKPEWDALLRAFCKEAGIEWQEPGWVLASYWG